MSGITSQKEAGSRIMSREERRNEFTPGKLKILRKNGISDIDIEKRFGLEPGTLTSTENTSRTDLPSLLTPPTNQNEPDQALITKLYRRGVEAIEVTHPDIINMLTSYILQGMDLNDIKNELEVVIPEHKEISRSTVYNILERNEALKKLYKENNKTRIEYHLKQKIKLKEEKSKQEEIIVPQVNNQQIVDITPVENLPFISRKYITSKIPEDLENRLSFLKNLLAKKNPNSDYINKMIEKMIDEAPTYFLKKYIGNYFKNKDTSIKMFVPEPESTSVQTTNTDRQYINTTAQTDKYPKEFEPQILALTRLLDDVDDGAITPAIVNILKMLVNNPSIKSDKFDFTNDILNKIGNEKLKQFYINNPEQFVLQEKDNVITKNELTCNPVKKEDYFLTTLKEVFGPIDAPKIENSLKLKHSWATVENDLHIPYETIQIFKQEYPALYEYYAKRKKHIEKVIEKKEADNAYEMELLHVISMLTARYLAKGNKITPIKEEEICSISKQIVKIEMTDPKNQNHFFTDETRRKALASYKSDSST